MPTPRKLTRRRFLSQSTALVAGAAAAKSTLTPVLQAANAAAGGEFVSNWKRCPNRVWIGPEYWSNPLQDWRVQDGRIECTNAAADRNVHVLVRSLGERQGEFTLRVRLGRVGEALGKGGGSAGFRFGIKGRLPDFRNALVFGRGVDAGVTADGGLFIGGVGEAKAGAMKLAGVNEAELRLHGVPAGDRYRVTLTVSDNSGRELGTVTKTLSAEQCAGGLALVNNFGAGAPGAGKGKNAKKGGAGGGRGAGTFWFADWRIAGPKVEPHPERTFGPLLFSHYTLSGGTMKLSAQLPPIGPDDTETVRLQTKNGPGWKTIAEEKMHPEARIAAFRVEKWDASKDVEYRLVYALKFNDGRTEEHHWAGTIRRDPTDVAELRIADVSCNIHDAFPNAPYVESVAKLKPDLMAFTGDQFYEGSGGFGVIRTPTDLAMIDYLRKWYLHGWTWRELMKDRPSVSLPDDHDVYQGNLWGEGGSARKTTQEAGGYDMPAEWVNVVYRTQTAHHPDPYAKGPAKRGTMQYFGAMTYGRVSFAILADRQYKSGPEGKVPPTGGPRGDHERNPNFDPKTADVPGLVLLGEEQEAFVREWTRDWRGAEMKVVISQTIFASFPTTHGREHMILRADYDSNGWPQTPRNRVVRELRKVFAFHLAGDQHIPGVVQYGVDEHRDGPVAFAGPAVNVGYPRWWEPESAPWTKPQQAGLLGDFTDSFGNPMTVLAVKNGALQPRQGDVLQFLEDKASGIGLVRIDKRARRIGIDSWPMTADVTRPGTQMPGWPVEVEMLQNYGRQTVGHLPPLKITGVKEPVVEVLEESSGELVYGLRVASAEFRPHVFEAGSYIVKVSDPESGKSATVRGLKPKSGAQPAVTVRV